MQNMIKIDFTISDSRFSYTDALYLPTDHTYTEEEIQAMKQERFDKWVDLITNPPPPPPVVEPPEEVPTGISDSEIPVTIPEV